MKGVILAGGTGSRLFPLTKVVNKHLLPVFDRPMIYYALEAMARAGIGQVLVVTGGRNPQDVVTLLGDGRQFGLERLQYASQARAGGIAQALGLARSFCGDDLVCLMLGDNLLERSIRAYAEAFARQGRGAKVLLARVADPRAMGVAELDGERVVRIVEKPVSPTSDWAVTGVYFYDSRVFEIIDTLRPSGRGELEITDVNNAYIARGELTAERVDGYWIDAGEDLASYRRAGELVARLGANGEHATPQRPTVAGLHHVQITVPRDQDAAARAFYLDQLGLERIEKPAGFGGGFWCRLGNADLHVSLEDGVDRMRTRAHVAYEVVGIDRWRERVTALGLAIDEAPLYQGHARFQFRDPFGNYVELIERI